MKYCLFSNYLLSEDTVCHLKCSNKGKKQKIIKHISHKQITKRKGTFKIKILHRNNKLVAV